MGAILSSERGTLRDDNHSPEIDIGAGNPTAGLTSDPDICISQSTGSTTGAIWGDEAFDFEV